MTILQKTGWLFLPVCLLSAAMACHNPARQQDSKEVAASFAVQAVAGFYESLQLAELANQKSGRPEVKQMADALKENYTPLLERFKTFAAAANIPLPSNEGKDARDDYSKLSALPPQQFDKQWCELLMEKHKKAIASYESIAAAAGGDTLQKLVMDALPALRRQYDMLMQYHHKL